MEPGNSPLMTGSLVAPNYGDEVGRTKQTSQRLGDVVLFAAFTPTEGTELWRTDGTLAGTTLVKDIWPGDASSISNTQWIPDFWVFNDILFFPAFAPNMGQELWRSDGTEPGTFMVQDMAIGANDFRPEQLTRMGGQIYLAGNVTGQGRGLFRMAMPLGLHETDGHGLPLYVSPNPTDGRFTVRAGERWSTGMLQWRMSDLAGRVVAQGADAMGGAGMPIDASTIGNGIYLFTLATPTGHIVGTARVVVAR